MRFALASLAAAVIALPLSAGEVPAPSGIKAFCIDFNWGPGGPNAFAGPGVWADASPEAHVRWYEGLGANVIQTFAVSCNGYAWYRGGLVPPQPGLAHDFLPEVVRLGHAKGMKVMGYFCAGANTRWGAEHPSLSYETPSAWHIPFTTEYLDFLCTSIEDALRKTGMDGFMIDWVWNASGRWLDCEKAMYEELLGKPFPGKDAIDPAAKLEFDRRAIERCWTRIRAAAKAAKPDSIIWLSCSNLHDPAVADSRMFREVDWLMNEAPDPASIEKIRSMTGPSTTLVQCLVGWGDSHDARRVLLDSRHHSLGIYGFARPGPDSFPAPIETYRSRPVGSFQGNDRNIAVLLRYFHGEPLEEFVDPKADGRVVLLPETASLHGPSPVVMDGQIGHWGNAADSVSWPFRLARGGSFEVRLTAACAAGQAGSDFRVAVGDKVFAEATAETGPTWRDYATRVLGTVTLPAGEHRLRIEPSTGKPWKALSVKSVELVPGG